MAKFIISGGGTGGHIYPAIAIADALKANDAKHEILFVGAEGKMEMEKVPKAGYQIIGLPIRGLQRSLTMKNLAVPFRFLASLLKARQIIQNFKPDVCIGVGGYASGAVLQMAVFQGIPTLLQEQNSYAGLTNKWLARFAERICVAYPNMERYFPASKLKMCGNPVRKDIQNLELLKNQAFVHFQLQPNRKTLFVMGGSLGAKTINESVQAGLQKLENANIQLIWQTGKGYFDKVKSFANIHKGLIIKDFIYEMNLAYACADVVISRAGALSISELCLAEKPTILVPSPNVAEDHQTKNALALTSQNAALLVKDIEAKNTLIDNALALLQDEAQQQKLKQNIKTFAQLNADETIVKEILKLVK